MLARTVNLIMLGLTVGATTGCQMLGSPLGQAVATAKTVDGATVLVREGLLLGGQIAIPEQGRAIDELVAEYLRPGALADPKSHRDYALVISRSKSQYLVPLELVRNTLAGSIHTLPGDRLELANIKGILNEPPDSSTSQSVKILGLHQAAGQDLPILPETEDVGGFSSDAFVQLPGGRLAANVVVLTRFKGGLIQNFIVPTVGLDSGVASLAAFKVHDGDVLNFTRLEYVDLVRAGRKRRLVTGEIARETADSLACHLSKTHPDSKHQAHFERDANGGNGSSLLRNLASDRYGLGKSLRSRLPW